MLGFCVVFVSVELSVWFRIGVTFWGFGVVCFGFGLGFCVGVVGFGWAGVEVAWIGYTGS